MLYIKTKTGCSVSCCFVLRGVAWREKRKWRSIRRASEQRLFNQCFMLVRSAARRQRPCLSPSRPSGVEESPPEFWKTPVSLSLTELQGRPPFPFSLIGVIFIPSYSITSLHSFCALLIKLFCLFYFWISKENIDPCWSKKEDDLLLL